MLRKHNPFGVLMRWILTLKDHATGFMYLCALPQKCPDLIAYKLQEIFGVIGYPKIHHTDNSKEFTAKSILQFLCTTNPNILTVTGHPRRLCDQGSIENMNKFVERVLGMVLAERRLAGENPNWTEVLGSVAATINLQHGHGKNNVSLYKAVFGHKFNHEFARRKHVAAGVLINVCG
jgi:transposase InsO family protein